MIQLAAHENFNNNIIRGVRRRNPAIDEVVLLATASLEGEWEGQVRYLPL